MTRYLFNQKPTFQYIVFKNFKSWNDLVVVIWWWPHNLLSKFSTSKLWEASFTYISIDSIFHGLQNHMYFKTKKSGPKKNIDCFCLFLFLDFHIHVRHRVVPYTYCFFKFGVQKIVAITCISWSFTDCDSIFFCTWLYLE